jgi:hypothetical protein
MNMGRNLHRFAHAPDLFLLRVVCGKAIHNKQLEDSVAVFVPSLQSSIAWLHVVLFFQQIGLLCCMEEFVIKVFNFITDQNFQLGLDSYLCFVSCIIEEEEEARLFSCSSSSSPSLSSSSSFSSSVVVAVVFFKNVQSWELLAVYLFRFLLSTCYQGLAASVF